ncbi:hypothetical protein ATV_gp46 [Bicaudavirus pozzuoliense]|uniref:Uncharacterized protein ORF38 n=2 Tax=Acidianus two-tailed virus TaxID=315953 RepID=Y038_ATV|nr:hypothetical protein ATV_gp46 [Acidianus two-tailed virus]Q3V4R4.1 RecName: Full=Uncharacterized protein ORF38 [Acidianus two-tailed virus]AON96524.1 hypothetical protein [Acidianus two-tailed phage variant 1]CAI59900.1 hypothetical protein [Acidianus two-tailed virus]
MFKTVQKEPIPLTENFSKFSPLEAKSCWWGFIILFLAF